MTLKTIDLKDAVLEERLESIAERGNASLEQVTEVYHQLEGMEDFHPKIILQELDFFFCKLGLDAYYFQATDAALIARHITAFHAGRIMARAGGESVTPNLHHESTSAEGVNSAFYAIQDDHKTGLDIEISIEKKYPTYRIQSYRTTGPFTAGGEDYLRLYFLTEPDFVNPKVPFSEFDIHKVASQDFLRRTTPATIERYQAMIEKAVKVRGPVIEISAKPTTQEIRVMIAFKRIRTQGYFSAMSDVLNAYGVHSNRKYTEHFSNGVTVYSFYCDEDSASPEALEQLQEDLSLFYVLPRTSLTPLFSKGKLSAQEVVYAYAAWKFVHQFISRYSDEYNALATAVRSQPMHLGMLNLMKHRLSKDTFTEARIFETIDSHPGVIKLLYDDFFKHHFVSETHTPLPFDLKHGEELLTHINKAVSSEIDRLILTQFLTFNRHILKTNFYSDTKTSLAFRLEPSFLSEIDYPEVPHGIFYLVGTEFRAFHIRFRDVARGGIRIVRSANKQAHLHNTDSLFNENYRLAHTQQRKNKDIPEGGSKGVILLSYDFQHRYTLAFKKYIGGLLDLMMPNDEIYDHLGKEELLFLGPDEGTADLMDWASNYARERGYRFWKSFTTGKSVSRGGIPHDLYGMTTRSVHQYVLGILRKLGLEESAISKFQTGGPDGDLGSNEIKISKDKTLSIVDGSGVLHDPDGLDRGELLRLAEARQMSRHFDKAKLGPKGFYVDVDDRDVILPNGRLVESGLQFRNTYHLLPESTAEFFVPCGGRPSAVHINNVDQLYEDGTPRFRYIVEGANLFFTQEARLHLEENGVVIFKDASANKGGVTSSSLEVLSGLALSDDEFPTLMHVQGEKIPEFYSRYVQEVIARIENNAALEFECIWNEHQRSGTPKSRITDQLSNKINELTDRIMASSLWDNQPLRKKILLRCFPKCLLELQEYETICQRVPENYLQAMFGSFLASHYIYKYGLQANEVAFFEFITRLID